ncbi:hypothetical protein Atai01_63290 [Amycolatopsis taiwanensis]|uniref:Uncharacterized protein n=1 Tax=Amycolatopsis taiwanensis TaxID=342230 RepID=A0A9W6VIH8_9PSEU|nr:hypothetical protein Atai01_63290 [Amycolatopsis taiwanensis]
MAAKGDQLLTLSARFVRDPYEVDAAGTFPDHAAPEADKSEAAGQGVGGCSLTGARNIHDYWPLVLPLFTRLMTNGSISGLWTLTIMNVSSYSRGGFAGQPQGSREPWGCPPRMGAPSAADVWSSQRQVISAIQSAGAAFIRRE